MEFAFDAHMHLLPLNHICLLTYLSFIEKNKAVESAAVMSAPDYLIKNIMGDSRSILNLLSIAEQRPSDMLMMYEDDLLGCFKNPDAKENIIAKPLEKIKEQRDAFSAHPISTVLPAQLTQLTSKFDDFIEKISDAVENTAAQPLMQDGSLRIGGGRYDYIVLNPLIMDFELPDIEPDIYYSRIPSHDVFRQAADILEGIREYRQKRPDGRLIVRPFMGVNPRYWSAEKLEAMLHTHFGKWDGSSSDALSVWKKLARTDIDSVKPYANAFAGIKVYPPLNFDPYPDDKAERDKLSILYSFCEKKGIPIITHCDDQGFRAVKQDDSFLWTNPERWQSVLREYPDLYIDIAHFGQQYYRGLKIKPAGSWRDTIVSLMCEYPHVYSDVSFGGVDSDMWDSIVKLSDELPSSQADILRRRLLFGTDWPLSLTKIESAAAYWRGFNGSALSNELKHLMISRNPQDFSFR